MPVTNILLGKRKGKPFLDCSHRSGGRGQGEGQCFLLGDARGVVGALISSFKQVGDTERSGARDHLSLGRIP